MGAALASPDPFAVRVLSCFMRRFAFSGLRIDEVRMCAQKGGDLVGCQLAFPAPRGCGSSSARLLPAHPDLVTTLTW